MEKEQSISAEEFPQWAADRLATHDRVIDMIAGQCKAMRYALIMLIAAHPDRETLRGKWQAISAELVDAEMDLSGYGSDGYREAFQSMLASVAKALDPTRAEE